MNRIRFFPLGTYHGRVLILTMQITSFTLLQFLNVWVLREYLELEMAVPAWKHDTERLIDDFIFICLLTGNDYIPRIPSLEIHEVCICDSRY
jgi:5'-3' exonuclease